MVQYHIWSPKGIIIKKKNKQKILWLLFVYRISIYRYQGINIYTKGTYYLFSDLNYKKSVYILTIIFNTQCIKASWEGKYNLSMWASWIISGLSNNLATVVNIRIIMVSLKSVTFNYIKTTQMWYFGSRNPYVLVTDERDTTKVNVLMWLMHNAIIRSFFITKNSNRPHLFGHVPHVPGQNVFQQYGAPVFTTMMFVIFLMSNSLGVGSAGECLLHGRQGRQTWIEAAVERITPDIITNTRR